MTSTIVIEGKISVKAVLRSNYRRVMTIFYDVAKLKRSRNTKKAKSIKRILELATANEIKIESVDQAWFEKNTRGKTHGGIAALVSRRTYQNTAELLESNSNLIFYLDGIEDPYNLGHTIRSLYTAGVDAVVMKQRNWLNAESIIIKSSAGTSELMPIALVENLESTIDLFKSSNFTIACTTKEKGQEIFKSKLIPPLFIVIGGEKRGIKPSLLEKADLLLKIPYGRDFNKSLPLNSAATVIAFEILRQLSFSS